MINGLEEIVEIEYEIGKFQSDIINCTFIVSYLALANNFPVSLLMFVNLRALVLNEHLNDLHLDGNLLKHELYDCVA